MTCVVVSPSLHALCAGGGCRLEREVSKMPTPLRQAADVAGALVRATQALAPGTFPRPKDHHDAMAPQAPASLACWLRRTLTFASRLIPTPEDSKLSSPNNGPAASVGLRRSLARLHTSTHRHRGTSHPVPKPAPPNRVLPARARPGFGGLPGGAEIAPGPHAAL